jgi:hypothetical protein
MTERVSHHSKQKGVGMGSHKGLDEFLREQKGKFEVRKKMLVMSSLYYLPTSEKVIEGFKYFDCPIGDLMGAFQRGDFKAISELPPAEDDDGDADTSSVRLDVAYTQSGSLFAAQPVEYQSYNPTAVADVVMLEGAAAKALLPLFAELDQSN